MAKQCIGLDIGSHSVKLVKLRNSRKELGLSCYDFETIPHQSIVDGSIINTGAIADAIREIFSRHKIRQKDVAVAVSGSATIMKRIELPLMSEHELAEQIVWEAEHHIPFAIEEVEIDHQILNKQTDQDTMEIMLVAAKKDVVADYIDVVREAKLNPVIVDIAAFAVQNCYEQNYGIQEEVVALIHCGAIGTTFNIVQHGISLFSRYISNGGESFTAEIQRQLNISREEAESMKLAPPTEQGSARPIIDNHAENMAGELQRTLDFYLATAADQQIDRILLSGGSSQIGSLNQALAARARIPVSVLNPFRGLIVDDRHVDSEFVEQFAPQASVATGLALRYQGDYQ